MYKYKRILNMVNKYSNVFDKITDQELKDKASNIRNKIIKKKNYNDIVAEAFAIVREADKRVIGLYPTNEQILGALSLYFGNIAEMKTGEGKTLVATMPLFLKAMYSKGVYLVTTNEYLAHRDFEEVGPVYTWLGLDVSDGTLGFESDKFDVDLKSEIYKADIIYTSNNILGFDYLIDALAENKAEKFMAPLNFAILDEVDAILLDSAQMPLLISGAPKVQSNYFKITNEFVLTLQENIDYEIDEEGKNVWLTETGIDNAKKYFNVNNILNNKFFPLYKHIVLALKAQFVLKKNKDYIVDDSKIKLLDYKNGRVMEGSNLQSGLHQAIQAKESLKLTDETQVISSITYQTLFRTFKNLAGMTGTAKTDESEFIETYNMKVIKIKTTKKNIRKDHISKKYVTFNAKFKESVNEIMKIHKYGRPILVVTGSVDASELYSTYLFNMGIAHNVLNAKSGVKEAQIIKSAGKKGAVTIATTMAGRGTDIKLDSESKSLGGLVVILTELMENKRIEYQARGRAGRQGEPGDTYAYESLEDEVIKINLQDVVQKYYFKNKDKSTNINNLKIKKAFVRAQKKSEDTARSERMNNLQFDEVLRIQKSYLDRARNKILQENNVDNLIEIIMSKYEEFIFKEIENKGIFNEKGLRTFVLDNVDYNFKKSDLSEFNELNNRDKQIDFISKLVKKNIEEKEKLVDNYDAFTEYLQIVILKALDVIWGEQVDALNQLRMTVQSRSTAQKNPILEFEDESKKIYSKNREDISKMIFRNAMLSLIQIDKEELTVIFP